MAYRRHVLVAEDVAGFHLRDNAAVDMKVGAADRARRDLDDRIARMFDFRIWDLFAANVAFAVPRQRSQRLLPFA